MSEQRLIVGLGNPGKQYVYTRHNVGFLVVEEIARQLKVEFKKSSFTNAFIAETSYEGIDLKLMLPLTYMNHSGVAIASALKYWEMDVSDILVVCDDFQLPFSQLRIRSKGSDGGHNGLNSVIAKLGEENFSRLRMGIGQPPSKSGVVDFVLEEFTPKEKEHLHDLIQTTLDCCLVWLKDGVVKAMESFNKRKE